MSNALHGFASFSNTEEPRPVSNEQVSFTEFSKIERLDNCNVTITQKLHGTNASVWIYKDVNGELQLKTGKRTGWCTPEHDNFGFSKFVHEHKQEFIDKLGEGVWYGEWVGPGINSGEGLTEKRLALFAVYKLGDRPLPPRVDKVPILWQGNLINMNVKEVMANLKINGSKYVPGFMRCEGIVIQLDRSNTKLKCVFEYEATQWRKGDKEFRPAPNPNGPDIEHLLQPIRLEKLLSRDEKYTRDYPSSLPSIASDYVADLLTEGEIKGTEDEVVAIKKALGKKLFGFIKGNVKV